MSNTPTHGSDVQDSPDWWRASDGRFYPPELHPDYQAVAATTAIPPDGAGEDPHEDSLAAGLGSEADRVGDEAAAAADAVAGAVDDSAFDATGAVSDTLDAATAAAGSDGPSVPPLVDQRTMTPTFSESLPAAKDTIIHQPEIGLGQPSIPSAGVPPAPAGSPVVVAPVGMPPAPAGSPVPVAPVGMPPAPAAAAPGVPPAPGFAAGVLPAPGAPTTAPVVAPSSYQQPASIRGAAKSSSSIAGLVAILGGAVAVAGSLLQWGKGAVTSVSGAEKAVIEVAGFDSNGLTTAIAGGVLILCGILFFMGIPKQLNWAILAFLGGGVIVGVVVFSIVDIGDLSNRYAAEWQTNARAAVGDVVSTQADLGLWLAGAGGVIGVLSAPFVNRE